MNKRELHILLNNKLRDELSFIYANRYTEVYPSFSIFCEAVIREGLEGFK